MDKTEPWGMQVAMGIQRCHTSFKITIDVQLQIMF